MQISNICWKGIPAVELKTELYKAVVLPTYGANCIQLTYLPQNVEILRSPSSLEDLQASAVVYGLPILFPPNRICDGYFYFEGRRYEFPINEPNRNHHIHGMLNSLTFDYEEDGKFSFHATSDNPYMDFPHQFSVERIYQISNDGLKHEIKVRNDGKDAMPMGIGIHTAINVPSDDAQLFIPVRREWLLNERFIPTEQYIDSSPLLESLRNGTLFSEKEELCALLETDEGIGRLICKKYMIQYEASDNFPFIMLWNNHGGKGFVCPEPQSWLTNAPNLSLSNEISGFRSLLPGETCSYSVSYKVMERE